MSAAQVVVSQAECYSSRSYCLPATDRPVPLRTLVRLSDKEKQFLM
jgi:hypothetical protein